jgi:hypothetical protein
MHDDERGCPDCDRQPALSALAKHQIKMHLQRAADAAQVGVEGMFACRFDAPSQTVLEARLVATGHQTSVHGGHRLLRPDEWLLLHQHPDVGRGAPLVPSDQDLTAAHFAAEMSPGVGSGILSGDLRRILLIRAPEPPSALTWRIWRLSKRWRLCRIQ